jgi:hypothetical protein
MASNRAFFRRQEPTDTLEHLDFIGHSNASLINLGNLKIEEPNKHFPAQRRRLYLMNFGMLIAGKHQISIRASFLAYLAVRV